MDGSLTSKDMQAMLANDKARFYQCPKKKANTALPSQHSNLSSTKQLDIATVSNVEGQKGEITGTAFILNDESTLFDDTIAKSTKKRQKFNDSYPQSTVGSFVNVKEWSKSRLS